MKCKTNHNIMKAKVLFTALAALSLAVACTQPSGLDGFEPAFGVKGITDNTISLTADAKDVSFTVSANISWTVSSDAQWLSVEPASLTIDDKKTADTRVTVKISANESEEAREATLTVAAEGFDPAVITVKQAGKEVIPSVLEVSGGTNTLTLTGLNGAAALKIHANVSWTAEASEWLTLDTSSWTFDGTSENADVIVTSATSATARSGQIKFSAEGVSDLVVTVNQTAMPVITIEQADVDYPYSQVGFTITTDDESGYYTYYCIDKATFDQIGIYNLQDNMVKSMTSYLGNYKPEVILSELATQGSDTYVENDLEAETTYVVLLFGVAYNDVLKEFVPVTNPITLEVTTTAAPVATEAYLAYVGTFKTTALDYFKDNAETEMTMLIEPFGINESYYVSFPTGTLSPVGSNGACDRFVAYLNEETGDIEFPAAQFGDLGAYWNFTNIGESTMLLVAYFTIDEETEVETWGFHVSADKNTLSPFTVPETPEGDSLLIGGEVYSTSASSVMGAYGYFSIVNDFVRVEEQAVASASKKALSMPKAFTPKQLKAAR